MCCEHPSTKVTTNDKISLNKKIIKLDTQVRLWKMYKPVKIICTNNDPENRKTIFSLDPKKSSSFN